MVVLGSSSTGKIDELGRRLLKLLAGEEVEPLKLPATVELTEQELEPLVGQYKLKELGTASVTLDDGRLYLQLTGQPKIGIYAESKTRFYCRPVEASFDFEADDDGKIVRMVIHQNGLDVPAQRVEAENEPAH